MFYPIDFANQLILMHVTDEIYLNLNILKSKSSAKLSNLEVEKKGRVGQGQKDW